MKQDVQFIKQDYNLRIVLAVLIMSFVTNNGFGQKANVLNLSQPLSNLQLGNKVDTTIFKHITHIGSISKRLLIYKTDYVYRGPQITFLDSIEVNDLFVGTNSDGGIQSIIILCKNSPSLRDYFLLKLGHYAIVSSSSIKPSGQRTEIWHKEDYALSLNTSTGLTGAEKDAIIILYDSDYSHLFKKELIDSIKID